jgi:hypothetical protein
VPGTNCQAPATVQAAVSGGCGWSGLLLCEVVLEFDVPELVHRPDLAQHPAVFVCVLQECHEIPWDLAASRY